jgi:hypothetical protein
MSVVAAAKSSYVGAFRGVEFGVEKTTRPSMVCVMLNGRMPGE